LDTTASATGSFAASSSPGQMHFWQYRIRNEEEVLGKSFSVLSTDERERANRLSRATARDRFILARGGLRCILGRYLDADPRKLIFAYGEHGKPYLEGVDLSFNLSHSEEMAVYAVAKGRRVGVDVEFLGRRVSRDAVVQRFFAKEEAAVLASATEEEKDRLFFTIWTLKEAYLKARGEGISVPLDSFAVEPGHPTASLLRAGGDTKAPLRWKLISVETESDYVAAICAEGQDWELERFTLPGS
jgi:4'-phosphopantetheinyl transferase